MLKVNLDFTELELFDDMVIVRVSDGIELDLSKYRQIMEVAGNHSKKPFGLILDEVYSHSLSFNVVSALRDEKNIICLAFVSYRPSTMASLAQSLNYIGKPGTFCGSVSDARSWVTEKMEELRKNGAA